MGEPGTEKHWYWNEIDHVHRRIVAISFSLVAAGEHSRSFRVFFPRRHCKGSFIPDAGAAPSVAARHRNASQRNESRVNDP